MQKIVILMEDIAIWTITNAALDTVVT
ncbi:unnamed protein product, partial [Allacma fusca]